MDNDTKCREAFEALAKEYDWPLRYVDGAGYTDEVTFARWCRFKDGWKACTAYHKAQPDVVDIKAAMIASANVRHLDNKLADYIMGSQPVDEALSERPYPKLLSDDEKKSLLEKAERLWDDLQEDKLGGFSGINRPLWIVGEFKQVLEEYGKRDVGLEWSVDDLKEAIFRKHMKGE